MCGILPRGLWPAVTELRWREAGWHLTDGRVTLSILPEVNSDFREHVLQEAGPDHIGFKVENLESFKQHLDECAGAVSWTRAHTPRRQQGSRCTARFPRTQARPGKLQICDPNAVLIDITDE